MKKNNDPVKHLKLVDPILAVVIDKVPRPEWKPDNNYFQALVKAIINQQLSDKAAATITRRFIGLFPKSQYPTPKQVLNIHDERIRQAGISYAKISYIKNLAQKIKDKTLNLEQTHALDDAEVIKCLVQVKGIGRWTAEMFLMFTLGREDVFSYGDLGLRNAIRKLYRLEKHPSERQAEKISNPWRPYRSWACRYLWASLEL